MTQTQQLDGVKAPRTRIYVAAAIAIAMTIANAFLHPVNGRLGYDEGDYFRAVHAGFFANWTDADDIPTSQFFSMGIGAANGTIPRGELSRAIRERRSTPFYRHYHPPFAFYPATIVHTISPDLRPEMTLRISNQIFLILWIALLTLLSLRFTTFFTPWYLLVIGSANTLASTAGFNMHIPFGLAVTTFFLCWAAWEQNRGEVWLRRMAIIFLAIAICTVEYSLFLLGILFFWFLVCFWRNRSDRKLFIRSAFHDLLWLFGSILVIWPAGLIQLGILKSYALQAFISLTRLGNAPVGFDSVSEMLLQKFSPSVPELMLLAIGLVGAMIDWRRFLRRGSSFVSLLLVLAIIIVQINPALILPWYLFPVFAIVFTFFIRNLTRVYRISQRTRFAIAVIVSILLFVIAQYVVAFRTEADTEALDRAIELAESNGLPVVTTLELGTKLGGYLPEREITGIAPEELQNRSLIDSLNLWRTDRMLILPDLIDIGTADESVGEFRFYIP